MKSKYYTNFSAGMLALLIDRFFNHIGWLNIPLIMYTMVLYTLKMLPIFSEHIILYGSLTFVGGIIFSLFIIYMDYKYIFESERSFYFKNTDYFENHFNEVRSAINVKRLSRIKNVNC